MSHSEKKVFRHKKTEKKKSKKKKKSPKKSLYEDEDGLENLEFTSVVETDIGRRSDHVGTVEIVEVSTVSIEYNEYKW